MSSVWYQFLGEILHQKTLPKQALDIFLVPSSRFQHFRYFGN